MYLCTHHLKDARWSHGTCQRRFPSLFPSKVPQGCILHENDGSMTRYANIHQEEPKLHQRFHFAMFGHFWTVQTLSDTRWLGFGLYFTLGPILAQQQITNTNQIPIIAQRCQGSPASVRPSMVSSQKHMPQCVFKLHNFLLHFSVGFHLHKELTAFERLPVSPHRRCPRHATRRKEN